MWKILQLKKPRDFIISTNTSHSVREFIEQTFKLINITIKWRGKGVNEVGLDQNNKIRVKISEKYIRPSELYSLRGSYLDSYKAFKWKPKIKFKELIKLMLKEEFIERKINFFKD